MLVKQKKHQHDKESNYKPHPDSQRQSLTSKNSLAATRRKVEISNKENFIQITEPLDSIGVTSQSKQFVLSRDSLSTNSRSKLKDISNTNSHSKNQCPPENTAKNQKEREQQLFDRRLSLKCTGNYSQQIDNQKSQRLSMAPLRRESFSTQLAPNHNLNEEKESISSVYQNSLFSSQSKSRQTLKKQAIITNLMNKLDHEEDLRSIIELKLKSGSSSTQLHRQKRNQSYMTDLTQQSSNPSMVVKLKQCQAQISYFKEIIKEMSEKIIELTEQKRFAKKSVMHVQNSRTVENSSQLITFLKKINDSGCQKCKNCSCRVKNAVPQSKTPQSQANINESFDFLDNLECTLKVLERKHI